MLQTTYNDYGDRLPHQSSTTFVSALDFPKLDFLQTYNYLGEYKTEVEKSRVRHNLGIPDEFSLQWGNIEGFIENQEDLNQILSSLNQTQEIILEKLNSLGIEVEKPDQPSQSGLEQRVSTLENKQNLIDQWKQQIDSWKNSINIPSKTSQLTNDSGYIQSNYCYSKSEVNGKIEPFQQQIAALNAKISQLESTQGNNKVWIGSQEEYNKLTSKNPDVLYVITVTESPSTNTGKYFIGYVTPDDVTGNKVVGNSKYAVTKDIASVGIAGESIIKSNGVDLGGGVLSSNAYLVFAIPSNEIILGIDEYSAGSWESMTYNTYANDVTYNGVQYQLYYITPMTYDNLKYRINFG